MAPLELHLVIRIGGYRKKIEFITRSKVNQVEGPAVPQRFFRSVRVDVKVTLQVFGEAFDVALAELGDNVDVSRGSLNAMDRTRDRSAQEISDLLAIERFEHALEGLCHCRHQVRQTRSQPYTRIIVSRSSRCDA